MLEPAANHAEELKQAWNRFRMTERSHTFSTNTWINDLDPETDNQSLIGCVSIKATGIDGYICAGIDHSSWYVTLSIISFTNRLTRTMMQDMKEFMHYLFYVRKFRKMSVSALVGSPSYQILENLLERPRAGYLVERIGIHRQHVRNMSFELCDQAMYDIWPI